MRKNEDLRRDLRLAIRTSIQDTEREVESIDNLEQVCKTQCGNFRIFLSLIFYVKSIMQNLEVPKVPVSAILGALSFVNLVNFSLQKVQNFIKIGIQSL